LEQGIGELDKNGADSVAAYLRQQIETGDLEGVIGFLEKVKEQA
jgi:hypothetical protein